MTVTVDELQIADPADVWQAAGFTVDPDDVCRIGDVRVRLGGGGTGILGWSLRGLQVDGAIDGIPTVRSDALAPEPATHANGVTGVDHVVLLSPSLARTVDSLGAVGLQPRRERDAELGGQPMRQVFFRLGSVILEVVGAPDVANEGPSSLWGITYVVADIDATAALFGDRALPVKDAVQPGRRITTLRHRDLGMSVRTAMISPPILSR
ncbi:glyoxalase [Mycolicibacterium sp. Dal123E01]|uniref:glyoxalase n=1 Tax=Mycolicibacterium sp. Dal123E01 TaxID=3457578 RepID=UPI00403E47F5